MNKSFKLYNVQVGYVDDEDEEVSNWRQMSVVAGDAAEAIRRARLKKNEWPESVVMISRIDRP